jgi:hypothetical protein
LVICLMSVPFERMVNTSGLSGPLVKTIERRIADEAPIVPLRNIRWTRVTSTRAANLVFSPFRGQMFEQMWVR